MKSKLAKQLKEEIDFCKKPIIFFDGDADGTTSFLQFYRYKGVCGTQTNCRLVVTGVAGNGYAD